MPLIFFVFFVFFGALEAKVALITGASQGIGLAAAKAFREKGWEVYAGVRQITPELTDDNPHIQFLKLDVTDPQSVHEAVRTVLDTSHRIDLLLNNAGYGLIGAEEMVDIEQVKTLFDVNVYGVLRLVQEVLPTMRAQKSGHIINISSTSGIRAIPSLGLYAASKFALEGLTEALAANVSPWNIRVTLLVPGTVNNDWAKHCEMGSRSIEEPFYRLLADKLWQRLISLSPNGQSPLEIANVIVSLAEAEKNDLRVPTSDKVESVMRKKLIDPSGNALHQEQLDFIKTVMGS